MQLRKEVIVMKLIFVRHGQSEWNKLNLFTGWKDVDLTTLGEEEAKMAGKKLKEANIDIDIAFTSVLKRAIKTCYYILDETDQLWVPVYKSWRLNERHYGALQGLNKAEMAEKYGEEQVHIWRRSYNVLPPAMGEEQVRPFLEDRRYSSLVENRIPRVENLEITLERVIPYFEDAIIPFLREGKNVLVAAHGNSLRALTKYIEFISDDDIPNLELLTGQPIVYELDKELNVLSKEKL